MQHFLEISQLTPAEISVLIQRALDFKQQFKLNQPLPQYPTYTMANLFYENSTRTRVSFELAAQRLEIQSVNLEIATSSAAKGETVLDTIQTLMAMGIQLFTIRHPEDGIVQNIADVIGDKACILNAGDGTHAHPSQALLDMMTIIETKPDVTQLKIVIVGDLKHSRVANSLQWICAQLGVKQLTLVAPDDWQPKHIHFGQVTAFFNESLHDADVIITLRVQRERFQTEDILDLSQYCRDYTLTPERLALAKPNAIVMHPGPINRDIEISSTVADGAQSVILQQVSNGVFMRMAMLASLVESAISASVKFV